MEQKELTISQPKTEEVVPAAQGPVELDPSLFAFVSGGLPVGNWGTQAVVPATAS